MAETLTLKSVTTRAETPSTQSFIFELGDDSLVYKPGQYVTVKLLDEIDDPRGPQRPFTLSSSPTDERHISIATKMTGSPFKKRLQWIAEHNVEPGKHLRLRGPMGRFTLDTERPVVCIAGGIGITPFRSMFRFINDRNGKMPVRLIYSNTTADDIAFRKELDELAAGGDWLRITYTITRSGNDEQTWDGRKGRIDADLISEASADLDAPLYYVCGPPGMVQAMTDILEQELGVPEPDLRTEKFAGY